MICEAPDQPSAATCLLEQTVRAPGRGDTLMSIQIRQFQGGGTIGMMRLHLGILVSRGVELRVDGGRAERLAVRSCHASGCIVPIPLNNQIERSFRRGLAATVTFFGGDGGRTDLEVSLLGFTKAITAFRTLD